MSVCAKREFLCTGALPMGMCVCVRESALGNSCIHRCVHVCVMRERRYRCMHIGICVCV